MPIKFVFCINSGRSGSDYLTALLHHASNAVSVHEGLPIMNGRPMQQFNNGDDGPLRELMSVKLREIHRAVKPGRIYCETNHSFIKGWGHLVPEFIPQEEIGVVVLRRDVDRTAHSLLRVHDVPGLTEWAKTWYLIPGSARDSVPLPKTATPLERCRWYVREIDERAKAFQQQFPQITYFECDLEELNDMQVVRRLFETFGLAPASTLDSVVGRRMNPKQEWPKVDIDELTKPAVYPRADDLSPDDRDNLLGEMLDYLEATRPQETAGLQADDRMAGTRYLSAIRLVAEAERELEEQFHTALLFTDAEQILMHELVRKRYPRDPVFLAHRREPAPGIAYRFDYNQVMTLRHSVRTLGIFGLLKVVGLAIRGQWRKDFSHRGEA